MENIKLTIDNREVEVPKGTTILDAAKRTDSGTHRTAFAFLRIDKVLGKFAALVGRTTLFIDMCQVFVIEVIHGRKDRVRRGLSQSAESGILYNHDRRPFRRMSYRKASGLANRLRQPDSGRFHDGVGRYDCDG